MPSTETPHLDLLFAGSVFCDLVFAGVPVPEPGAEVFADAFKLTPGGVANRAVAGSRLGARTALLSQLGDDPLGLHMVAVLSAEPDLDLTWLRCTPGFQSPVTVSLTGVHEREFITYQEEADPLEWPVDRPFVGATHVSMQRDLPDWVARLREQGTVVYGGVGWDSSGMWSGEVLSRLDIFVKDMGIVGKATRAAGLAAPVAAAAEQLYLLGQAQGLAAADDSAVIKVLAPTKRTA